MPKTILLSAVSKKYTGFYVKKTHPDLTKQSGESFIRLKAEYIQALEILTHPTEAVPASPENQNDPRESRRIVLEHLYYYALKLFGSSGEESLNQLITVSEAYRPDVYQLCIRYRDVFYKRYIAWENDPKVCYVHSYLIKSVKQLFDFYENPIPRQKSVLDSFLDELRYRCDKLNNEYSDLAKEFGLWIKTESDNEPIAVR